MPYSKNCLQPCCLDTHHRQVAKYENVTITFKNSHTKATKDDFAWRSPEEAELMLRRSRWRTIIHAWLYPRNAEIPADWQRPPDMPRKVTIQTACPSDCPALLAGRCPK